MPRWLYKDDALQANISFAENVNQPADGKFDENAITERIDAPVGRIDFYGLTEYGGTFNPPIPGNSKDLEIRLLKRYFDKNHRFRVGENLPARGAIIDDELLDGASKNAWDQFAALVGGNTIRQRDYGSNVWRQGVAPQPGQPDTDGYLFASGEGSGSTTTAGAVIGIDNYVNPNSAGIQTRAAFVLLHGSIFGDWDMNNNLLRATLAHPGFSVATAWGGRPGLLLHTMGIGETIGEALLVSQNRNLGSPGYRPNSATLFNTSHISLLGDPTLHALAVRPPSNVTAQRLGNGHVRVQWSHSPDQTAAGFLGYRVFRSTSQYGPFEPVGGLALPGATSLSDVAPMPGSYYMVRAVRLEDSPQNIGGGRSYAGSYQNLSQGAVSRTFTASVVSATFSYETSHAIVVQFDRDVRAALDATDLTLEGITNNPAFSTTPSLEVVYDENTNVTTATFTFPNATSSLGLQGKLPDDNYRATIPAEAVVIDGEPLATDMVLDFYFLAGDFNGDRQVWLSDSSIIYAQFNSGVPVTYSGGNIDYSADGFVSQNDIALFNPRYGATLPAPAAAPDSIAAAVLERGEVVIQWVDTVVGETGWRVQLSEDGQNWWHVNVPANEQTRVITGLEDGRKYWFRVRAFSDLAINPDGRNTAYTAKRSAVTLLPAPDQLVVTSPLAFTVHLSWRNNGGANVDQFVVQRSTNLVDWSDIVISGSATEFVDTGQDSGHTIFYRVFARNNLIQSAPTIIEQVIVA